MPENISTYWAKNVKIKTLRGDKFEFALNVKNKDGSNYSFPEGHEAFFAAFQTTSNPIGLSMPSSFESSIVFKTLVEEGKITVNTFGEESGFWALPGTYSYICFTYNPEDVGLNLESLMENIIPNYHLRVGWMHEESQSLWSNPNQSSDDRYYHEWYHLPNPQTNISAQTQDNYPCYTPEWAVLKANQETGENMYYENPLADFQYVANNYLDNNDVWNGDTFTFKDGIQDLLLKLIVALLHGQI